MIQKNSHSFLIILMLIISSCVSSPPEKPDNICEIFQEKRNWYKAAIKSEKTRILAFVWATRGYDIAGTVKPAPLSVDKLKEALIASSSRPRQAMQPYGKSSSKASRSTGLRAGLSFVACHAIAAAITRSPCA